MGSTWQKSGQMSSKSKAACVSPSGLRRRGTTKRCHTHANTLCSPTANASPRAVGDAHALRELTADVPAEEWQAAVEEEDWDEAEGESGDEAGEESAVDQW